MKGLFANTSVQIKASHLVSLDINTTLKYAVLLTMCSLTVKNYNTRCPYISGRSEGSVIIYL
jgi:hypothetical protein